MRAHKLYPDGLRSPHLDRCESLRQDCNKCNLCESASQKVPGEGDRGGVLVVGEGPGRNEDVAGRPFVGQAGALLRRVVQRASVGPIAYANATRCRPGSTTVDAKHIDACRPYLAQEIRDYHPGKIVTLGGWAAYSVLGRSVQVLSVRTGYSFVVVDGRVIPVVMCIHPAAALRNQFVRQWFEKDLVEAFSKNAFEIDLDATFYEVESVEDAREALSLLVASGQPVAFDVETCGILFDADFSVLSVGLSADGVGTYVWKDRGLDELLRWFENRHFPKFGHNVKFDCAAISCAFRVEPKGICFDTRLGRKILEPDAHADLATCAELVGLGGHKEEAEDYRDNAAAEIKKKLQKRRKQQLTDELSRIESIALRCTEREEPHDKWSFALLPHELLLRYNARDTYATAKLGTLLGSRLRNEPQLAGVWANLVAPANESFVEIERWGFKVSCDAIRAFDAFLELKLQTLGEQLRGYDPDRNWNSPAQVAAYLFGKLQLVPPKTTKGGANSADSSVLEILRSKHPLPGTIADFRHYAKLRSSYGLGVLKYVRSDGRVHAQYLLDGARTGRLSCVDPPIQTIPRPSGTDEDPTGKMARDCYVADDGYVLISADYSQIELRVAALLSNDRDMIEIFRSGADYHQRTAELISRVAWGIEPSQVEKRHRTAAKSTNFGLIYGMWESTLAKRIGCTVAEASAIREAILGKFVRLAAWLEEQKEFARRHGYVETYWAGMPARRRPVWGILDSDELARGHAENAACNTPVQGSSADFTLASLAAIVRWIREDAVDARVVATVHDSILLEARKEDVPEVTERVKEIMTSWPSGDVPIVVDLEIGPSWGSMEQLKV